MLILPTCPQLNDSYRQRLTQNPLSKRDLSSQRIGRGITEYFAAPVQIGQGGARRGGLWTYLPTRVATVGAHASLQGTTASVTPKIDGHGTRRRHKVLGKGGGHHPPPPWRASALDEAAGGSQHATLSVSTPTATRGSSPAELLSHKNLYTGRNLAQTRLVAVGHKHVTLSTTTDPGLRPSKPKPQLGRVTKMLRGIMSHQKLRIRILLLIN